MDTAAVSQAEARPKFVVGELEARSKVLKRRQRKLALPKIGQGDRELAKTAQQALGYTALTKRIVQIDQDTEERVNTAVDTILEEAGTPPPLSEGSVREYQEATIANKVRMNRIKLVVGLCLLVLFTGPRSIWRTIEKIDREKQPWDANEKIALFICAMGVWLVGILVVSFIFGAIPALVNLTLSAVFPGVCTVAVAGLFGSEFFPETSKILERKEYVWDSTEIAEYQADIPQRVIDNSIILKNALEQEGFKVCINIVYLKQQDNRLLKWLQDPFVRISATRGGHTVQFWADVWDEQEYNRGFLNM